MTEVLKTYEKVAHLAAKGLAREEIATIIGSNYVHVGYLCRKHGIETVIKRKRDARSEVATGFDARGKKQFAVRIEPAAYAQIADAAKARGVSIQHQARMILEAWASK